MVNLRTRWYDFWQMGILETRGELSRLICDDLLGSVSDVSNTIG